jgi:DNA-binding Lrp family transcriptional regulator
VAVEHPPDTLPISMASPADAVVARIVTRLSAEYVLRIFHLTIDVYGDLRAGLVAQAIHAANTAHFNAHNEWGRLAVGADVTFPDEARRPISVARVADSLGLPFESTRRIVQRLIDTGACTRAEDGVVVPMASEMRPEVGRAVTANVGYVRRLVRDLRAVGLVEDTPLARTQAGQEAVQDTFTARAVARLSAEYLLRAFQLLVETYGDIQDGIIAHTIVTANTAYLSIRTGEGWRYAGIDETPPDEARRPISIARLAESLGLPFETTRRRVRKLMDAGTCIRMEGGLIVPQVVLERPAAVRSAIANVGYVRKFARDALDAGLEVMAR